MNVHILERPYYNVRYLSYWRRCYSGLWKERFGGHLPGGHLPRL